MQLPRSVIAVAFVGLVAAACGSSSPTQAPGATQGSQATQDNGGGGGGATDEPQATQGSGGGGSKPAGWDQFGKVAYQISAPLSMNGELGFLPAASIFAGDQGTSLSFTVAGTSEVFTIAFTQGTTTISWGSEAGTVVGSTCTTSGLSIQGSSASGSFECTDVIASLASGAQVTGVTIKGSFNVHG